MPCIRQCGRDRLRWIESGWASGLDIMKNINWRASTKGFIGEVAVQGSIHCENKCREADEHPCLVRPIECTATLGCEVRSQAVERHHETRDVEGVSYKDTLTIEGNHHGAATQDWNEGIIAHAHLQVGDGFVRDEGSLIWKHVVGGSGVGHSKALG
jgi:hypothetical protein